MNKETTTHESVNNDNTINFMYFISNYPNNFIHEVWQGSIADHFNNKFSALCARHQKSDLAFLRWFYELSTDHQRTLLNWVNQNYNANSTLNLSK